MSTNDASTQSPRAEEATTTVATGTPPEATVSASNLESTSTSSGLDRVVDAVPDVGAMSTVRAEVAREELHYATKLPRPNAWVRVTSVVLGTASALAAAYLLMTEINLARYLMTATMWTRWAKPQPETALFLLSPLLTALTLLPTIIGAGLASYHLAFGARWARWVALGACLTSGLSVFIHWSTAPLWVLMVLGTLGCFLPPVRRFCSRLQEIHAPGPQFPQPPLGPVIYGPAKRFG